MTRRAGSLADRTIRGLAWSFLGVGGQSLVNALVVVVLARLLSPTEFGLVGAALIVVGLTQIFTQLGVGPALVHLQVLRPVEIRTGFTISVSLGCVAAIVVALAAPTIADFFQMPELRRVVRVMALTFPIAGAATVPNALQQRDMQFRTLAMIQFTSFVLGYGLIGVTLALLDIGVWSLVCAQLGQTVLGAVLSLSIRREAIGVAFPRAAASQLLFFGTGFSLARIANYLANQGDNLIVGRFLGADALGIYGRSYQFVMIPVNLIGSVLDRVLFPAMASVQLDVARLGAVYLRAVGGIVLLTMPLSAVLYVIAPEIVLVALGQQWSAATEPLQVLVLFLVFRTAYKVSDSLARATGAVYRRAWRQSIYAGAVFIGAWLGQMSGSTSGVAIGVGVAILINFVLMHGLAVSLTNITWRPVGGMLVRHGLLATVMGSVAYIVKSLVAPLVVAPLLTGALAGIVPTILWLGLWKWAPRVFGPEAESLHDLVRRIVGLAMRYRPDAKSGVLP